MEHTEKIEKILTGLGVKEDIKKRFEQGQDPDKFMKADVGSETGHIPSLDSIIEANRGYYDGRQKVVIDADDEEMCDEFPLPDFMAEDED